jgi:two-component system, NarL family, nitrate/nitrite response regulator NarL
MSHKTRVTILEDHQSIIDDYLHRLRSAPQIEVAATLSFGEELEASLARRPSDVLLLDVSVPTSAENPNPYPVLYWIPELLNRHPHLNILVITMHMERGLMRAVLDTGASGYVLKDDQMMIRDLANVVLSVASGGIVLSQQVHRLLRHHEHTIFEKPLSSRQLEALSLCGAYPEWSTAELSGRMSVSNSTVRNLLSSAYLRLGVHTRMAAVAKAREMGILASFPQA